MRTFIAIELSGGTRGALSELVSGLRRDLGKIRWVRPGSMHLTLKFLGEIGEEKLEPVGEKLEEACRGTAPCSFRVVGLGCFPNPRRPRVIWTGLEGDIAELIGLQRQIDEAMASLGFPPEGRSFSPHVTLGRVRGPVHKGRLEAAVAARAGQVYGEETVSEIVFMHSLLRPEGPLYTPISRVPLGP